MAVITETHVYAVCPHCGEKDARVDHLFTPAKWEGPLPRSFGPWWCKECGGPYHGQVAEDKQVTIVPCGPEQPHQIKTWVLLKIETADPPVYFVVSDYRMSNSGPDGERPDSAGHRYIYEEHTCPTNWTGRIKDVIVDEDDDPHGFASYVKTVDAKPLPDTGEYEKPYEGWAALFPEAFSEAAVQNALRIREENGDGK